MRKPIPRQNFSLVPFNAIISNKPAAYMEEKYISYTLQKKASI